LQAVAGLEMATLDNRLGERTVFPGQFLELGSVQFAVLGIASIDQQQILHFVYSSLIGWIADTQSNGPHAKRHRQDKLFSARKLGASRQNRRTGGGLTIAIA
jgi:hypothetical protein